MSTDNTPSMSQEQTPEKNVSLARPVKVDGARRMGVTFNPSKDPRIDEIKQKFAELHDLIDTYGADYLQSEKLTDDLVGRGESARATNTALTHLQIAKMFSVEALTR